ncbi:MAG: hypothetical protein VF00_C0007G0006 [candidate division Kazan bacterium GW2011_GWB1_52_7]|uniref:DUF2993 domain-containing protein n=1 Tax=candidate division Kazan bacterium GW2011_GWB1_52_7 TaxID=1620414 RepID=A0A0G2A2N7_UNCK3|nr:MAG: hypothetical protein VF00_C0007G0006 [candidate division Kazan bacterium GW2011_GWB1_52_7]
MSSPSEEKPPVKPPEEKKKGRGKGCLKILLIVIAVLFFLFLLVSGAIAIAITATGLVKVPFLSNIIKPPAITEDFSYKKVSDKQLNKKLETAMSGTEGNVKATVTLTDDEVNTLVAGIASTPDSSVKSILVKFRPGVVKISGVLSQNDAPFYGELKIAKSASSFEFEFQNVRLGALPLPGFLVEGLISQVAGTGQLLGNLTADSLPVDGITVKDGSITIKGLDLSGLDGPGE